MTTGTADATVPDITSWPPLDPEMRTFGRQLLDWVADDSGARPRLCLLRGAEGSGKSRLLAWFLAGSAGHPRTTVHATVPAAGLTAETFAWELGRQLGYGPLSPARLLDRIGRDERPLLLFVPDAHRSGAGPADLPAAAPATLVAELLEPLLSLPHLRAAVEVGGSGLLLTSDAESIHLGSSGTSSPDGDDSREHSGKTAFTDLIAAVPRTPDGRPDWSEAPDAVRRHVLDMALRADDGGAAVRSLLADPGFLVHGPATAVTAVLADERIPVPGQLRRVWRLAAPELTALRTDAAERAALLHAAAVGTDATLTEYLRPLAQRHHWSAAWARPDLSVAALALVPGDERHLLVADTTGRLRTYDVDTATGTGTRTETGTNAQAAPISSSPFVRPVSVAPRDARSMLLLDEAGTLLPLTAEDEDGMSATVLGHIAEHHGSNALTEADSQSRVTALGSGPYSPYAVVGDQGGTLHVWSLSDYQDTPRSCRVHEQPVIATACLHVPTAELTLAFSAALDGSVRLWETSAEPMPVPVEQRRSLVTALAAADTPVGPVLAVAWSDNELHLWDVFSGRMQVLPLLHACRALALTPEGLLVIGGAEGSYAVRLRLDALWDR
ncbi:hypothetical protein [Streptomyces poonensis]|uniref:Uncharacterized protein n=1 Tax=Streptomyces poonensis TaxID=68255 RepID=A0A918UX32_9ACTN|nr:hypothetical protein [Streptomyces poonensis]GGZ39331.1 hypothetical protein GCM10010365_70130 [Streptomyces poonensis]GLJ93095.1 hypothetical protein GCM10017589_57070 [Streptomyces poonensis]